MSIIETTVLMEKLRSKLRFVRDWGSAQLRFSPEVVGVVDCRDVLIKPKWVLGTASVSATGDSAYVTVPEGHRYRVRFVVCSNDGVFTEDGIKVQDIFGTKKLVAKETGASEIVFNFDGQELVLDEGYILQARVDSYTSTGTLTLGAYVEDELLEG